MKNIQTFKLRFSPPYSGISNDFCACTFFCLDTNLNKKIVLLYCKPNNRIYINELHDYVLASKAYCQYAKSRNSSAEQCNSCPAMLAPTLASMKSNSCYPKSVFSRGGSNA